MEKAPSPLGARVTTVEDYDESENQTTPESRYPAEAAEVDHALARPPGDARPAEERRDHLVDLPILPVRESHIERHRSPQSTYDEEENPPQDPLPTVPTPPAAARKRASKTKMASSSHRRKKDKPQYYGVSTREDSVPAEAVFPAPIDPGYIPRSKTAWMTRRATTGWYEAGPRTPISPPTQKTPAVPAPDPGYDSRPTGASNPGAQPTAPPNAFRTQRHLASPQRPPSQSHPSSYPHRHRDIDPPMEEPYHREADADPRSRPPPSAGLGRHGVVVLSQGGQPRSNNTSRPEKNAAHEEWSSQPPPSRNPHGTIVLSSNDGPQPSQSAQRLPAQRAYEAGPNPSMGPNHTNAAPRQSPTPHPHGLVTLHQRDGPRSQNPMDQPPPRPRTGYREDHDYPPRERGPIPAHPVEEFERFSLQDTRSYPKRAPQDPPMHRPDYVEREHAPPPSRPNPRQEQQQQQQQQQQQRGPPIRRPPTSHEWREERDVNANTHDQPRYASHAATAQDYSSPQRPPYQPESPSPPEDADRSRNWPQVRRSSVPEPLDERHTTEVYRPNQGRGREGQRANTTRPSRQYRARGPNYTHSRDTYNRREDAEPEAQSDPEDPDTPPAWTNKPSDEPPMLPDGHPFLEMKEMAFAAALKEFRSWQGKAMETRRSSSRQRLPFACPFAKRTPMQYKDCFSDSLYRIQDVKDHIMRCHAVPIYCPRCMELFDDEKARDHHIRYAGCRSQPWEVPDGITESQKRELQKGGPPYLSKKEQWNLVFDIVFQRQFPPPPSPYVDGNLHEDITMYQEFLDRHGPRVLSDILTFRGAATWNLANEERDLAAFRRLVLKEGIRDMVEQSLGHPQRAEQGRPPQRSPPSLGSSHTSEPQRTPSMGSFGSNDSPRSRRDSVPSGSAGHHQPQHWEHTPGIREDAVWDEEYDGRGRDPHADYPPPTKPGNGRAMAMYPSNNGPKPVPYYN